MIVRNKVERKNEISGGIVTVLKPDIETGFGITFGVLGRPRDGVVYETYKQTKFKFRRICCHAVNEASKINFKKCSIYFKQRCMSTFWNMIRESKTNSNKHIEYISVESFERHFKDKFSYDIRSENEFISNARQAVLK